MIDQIEFNQPKKGRRENARGKAFVSLFSYLNDVRCPTFKRQCAALAADYSYCALSLSPVAQNHQNSEAKLSFWQKSTKSPPTSLACLLSRKNICNPFRCANFPLTFPTHEPCQKSLATLVWREACSRYRVWCGFSWIEYVYFEPG